MIWKSEMGYLKLGLSGKSRLVLTMFFYDSHCARIMEDTQTYDM